MDTGFFNMVVHGPVGAKPGTKVLRIHNRRNNAQIELTAGILNGILVHWFLMRKVVEHEKMKVAIDYAEEISSRALFSETGFVPMTYSVYRTSPVGVAPCILYIEDKVDDSPLTVILFLFLLSQYHLL